MLLRHVAASALFLSLLATPALAETLSCPDLTKVVQAGACPTEEELQYTYIGYCSEDARAYRLETGVCVDYKDYRKLKNISLWETQDGAFQSYVSCDLPLASWRSAKPVKISLAPPKRGEKMTRLMCDYGNDVVFTHRTHAACKVEGEESCVGNAAGCKASCQ